VITWSDEFPWRMCVVSVMLRGCNVRCVPHQEDFDNDADAGISKENPTKFPLCYIGHHVVFCR